MTPRFHSLNIRQIRQETPNALSIVFDVPEALKADFKYVQGQHVTLKKQLNNEELRRSYSICSAVSDDELRVAVKRVEDGVFSNWIHQQLKVGQSIEVMTPEGRFFTQLNSTHKKHYVAFVAGSGITPILSLIKTTLITEPNSRFTLVYGNRKQTDALFQEELEDLKNKYLTRFQMHNIFSREEQEAPILNGRLDGGKVQTFLKHLIATKTIDEVFVCGPHTMIDEVESELIKAGINAANIHAERFGVPPSRSPAKNESKVAPGDAAQANVTVIADGLTRTVQYFEGDASILDVALASGMDLPFSCKGGVCNTCRCRLIKGKVRMVRNFALEPHEVEEGFVLSCQSHPLTDDIVISFDNR